jgi:hypothetical protein
MIPNFEQLNRRNQSRSGRSRWIDDLLTPIPPADSTQQGRRAPSEIMLCAFTPEPQGGGGGATEQERTRMQTLAADLIPALEVWRDLAPTQRPGQLANHQRLIREMISGILQPGQANPDWTAIGNTLRRAPVLAALNAQLHGSGFEVTMQPNGIVFHRRNGERNLLLVPFAAQAGGQDINPTDRRLAREATQHYAAAWVFHPARLATIIRNHAQQGWADPDIREERRVDLNRALARFNLRADPIDPNVQGNGWEMIIRSTAAEDRIPAGQPNAGQQRIRGRVRLNDRGVLVFHPEREAQETDRVWPNHIARFLHGIMVRGTALTNAERTRLFTMFMDLETPRGLDQATRARRVEARTALERRINEELSNLGEGPDRGRYYVRYHEGNVPTLRIFDRRNPIVVAGVTQPNRELPLRPSNPDQATADRRGGFPLWLIPAAIPIGLFGVGLANAIMPTYRAWRASGARAAGAAFGSSIWDVGRFAARDMWLAPTPDTVRLALPDTVRGGSGNAAANQQSVRLADAPEHFTQNGVRVETPRAELLELGRRFIESERRRIAREIEQLETNRPRRMSDREYARRLDNLRTQQTRLNSTQPGDVVLVREPGTGRISGARVAGALITGAAAIYIISSWLRSMNPEPPPTNATWQ